MFMKDIADIRERASNFINSKTYAERKSGYIEYASAQITTLLAMKDKISETSKKQCLQIDEWVNNIACDLNKDLRDI